MIIKWERLVDEHDEYYRAWMVGFEEKPYEGDTKAEALGKLMLGFTTALDISIEEATEND